MTALPISPAAAEPESSVRVPVEWLLAHGSRPVQVRTLLELAHVADSGVATAVYGHEPALRIAVRQTRDGTWGGRMLALSEPADATFAGLGAVPAVRRLLEYGWDPESPPLQCARKPLFRLLAEDADPEFLYELRAEATDDEHAVRRGRSVVREAAASALAQLGCESDPRLRGAATRMLDRVGAFLRLSVPAGPEFNGAAGRGLLPPSAAVAPSAHFLVMLGFMPRFRSEHGDELQRLCSQLALPAPEVARVRGAGAARADTSAMTVLGDPLVGAAERIATGGARAGRELPTTLAWLEVLARVGFLRQHVGWTAALDALLAARDANGVWRGRPDVRTTPSAAWAWPTFPLADPTHPEQFAADVTFRLALVARLAGRRLELV